MQNRILESHEWFNNRFFGGMEMLFFWGFACFLPEIAVRKFMPCNLVSLNPRLLINENEQLLTLHCSQYAMI